MNTVPYQYAYLSIFKSKNSISKVIIVMHLPCFKLKGLKSPWKEMLGKAAMKFMLTTHGSSHLSQKKKKKRIIEFFTEKIQEICIFILNSLYCKLNYNNHQLFPWLFGHCWGNAPPHHTTVWLWQPGIPQQQPPVLKFASELPGENRWQTHTHGRLWGQQKRILSFKF